MKKSLKDKIKYNFKEMWEDETEDEAENKPGFRTLLLEVPLNLLRFELLYPKFEEDYDGATPKGYFHALIANVALGYYIGSQVNGESGAFMGSFIGACCVLPQMFLGTGVRGISNSISEKCKEMKEKKKSLNKII